MAVRVKGGVEPITSPTRHGSRRVKAEAAEGGGIAPALRRRVPCGNIETTQSLFGALHALAVDDRSRRTRLSAGQFAGFHIERVMNAVQRAVVIQAPEIIIDRAARW